MGSENNSSQPEILKALRFPVAVGEILRKRQTLKRELLKQTNLVPTRIAILGGSTTTEVKSMLELFLLAREFSRFSTNRDTTVISKTWYSRMPSCGTSNRILSSSIPLGTTFRDFPNCWSQKPRSKAECAGRWRGLNPCGKKFTPNLGRSLFRTTLIFPTLSRWGWESFRLWQRPGAQDSRWFPERFRSRVAALPARAIKKHARYGPP